MNLIFFKNHKTALLFVVLTLAGVALFVGEEGGDDALTRAVAGISDAPAETNQSTTNSSSEELEDSASEYTDQETSYEDDVGASDFEFGFATDEDLIDSAEGYDPTPQPDGTLASELDEVPSDEFEDEPEDELEITAEPREKGVSYAEDGIKIIEREPRR